LTPAFLAARTVFSVPVRSISLDSLSPEPAANTTASAPTITAANSGPLDLSRSSIQVSAPALTSVAMCLGFRMVASTLSPWATNCLTISMPVRPWPPMTMTRIRSLLLRGW
jgi:hypothetical protein